jgi:hypothetical protein
MIWYLAGSVVGGAALGGGLGAFGSLLRAGTSTRLALGVLALVVATGIALDLGVLGSRLPTVHRQVNEDWLSRYRGWLYGFGFGLQLGAGIATVVAISAVYAAFAAALLSGSAGAGLLIGAGFGLARATMLFTVVRVRRADQLVAVDRRLRRWDQRSRRLAIALEAILLLVAAVAVLA